MNYRLTFKTLLFVAALAMPGLNLRADTCDSVVCGDADGSGTYNINDITFITNFLFAEGPAPALCGDIDGYDLITIRDIVVGATMQPASCVTQPKIVAQPTSQLQITCGGTFPLNQSSITFELLFRNISSVSIHAFDLPLAVRVGGAVPLSISANLATSTWPGEDITITIDTGAGTLLLSDLDGSVPPGEYNLCSITLEMSPSPLNRPIEFEYTEIGPRMTGVFEPPNSACHYPMFLDDNLNALQPILREYCLCGDGNGDGRFTISDPIYILSYIFAGGQYPSPICLGDANGNGIINISDAIYLINYIFGGGPEPHCP